MASNLAIIEPLKVPDRPDRMPSWPAWVASRIASASEAMQSDANGKWRMVTTLPAGMLLASSERQALDRHVVALERVLGGTPTESATAEAEMLVVVSKMMLALPGQKATEAGAEASGEAYCAALDDLPPWSVVAALRKWYRGDVPAMPKFQQQHNFNWRPAPAILRSIAFKEACAVRGRILDLQRLLQAEARVEYSEEHRGEMLSKLQTIMPGRKSSPQSAAPEQPRRA